MYDIEKDITNNFDGMHLNTDNIPKLYALYGEERMNYVLANTVQMFESDGRFSLENKEWAKSININNSDEDRRNFTLTVHRAVLDGYITSYRKKVKEFKEELDKEGEMPENEQTKRGGALMRGVLLSATCGTKIIRRNFRRISSKGQER